MTLSLFTPEQEHELHRRYVVFRFAQLERESDILARSLERVGQELDDLRNQMRLLDAGEIGQVVDRW